MRKWLDQHLQDDLGQGKDVDKVMVVVVCSCFTFVVMSVGEAVAA